MCGIAGYIGNRVLSESKIRNTLNSLNHRGPDYSGFYCNKIKENLNIYLLHTRLSILDLHERSNQPMEDEKGVITFNGEIYNFLELKKKLLQEKVSFNGKSDTEVLLKYINIYGIDSINDFNGMWSFIYFNKVNKNVYLCRDRLGEKPLYYFQFNEGIYFASEIKVLLKMLPIKAKINFNQLYTYLIEGYISIFNTGQTFFENVIELTPASILNINPEMQINQSKFWTLKYEPKEDSYENYVKKIKTQFIQSVESRLISDVPVCALLSGGIDSSSIVSVVKNILGKDITTFSVFNDDSEYSENKVIESTAKELGIKNINIKNKLQNPKQEIFNLTKQYASPLSTPAILFNNQLFQFIKKNNFKVSLMGTGGDEALTGYYEHFIFDLVERYNTLSFADQEQSFLKYVLPLINNPHLKNYKEYFYNNKKRDHLFLNKKLLSNFIDISNYNYTAEKNYSDSVLRNRMLNLLFNQGVKINLHEIDLNSMQSSVENRAPLLDHNFLELCYTVPNKYLIRNGLAKILLRDAMKGVTPEIVINSRNKHSLNISFDKLFDLKSNNFLDYLYEDDILSDYKVIKNKKSMVNYIKSNNITNSFGQVLFRLLSAKEFLKIYG